MVFLSLAVFVVAALAFAAEEAKQPLRPAQKIMQNRVVLLKGDRKSVV